MPTFLSRKPSMETYLPAIALDRQSRAVITPWRGTCSLISDITPWRRAAAALTPER